MGIMEECGLASYFLHRYPHQFSGGQRQRIGIARSLVNREARGPAECRRTATEIRWSRMSELVLPLRTGSPLIVRDSAAGRPGCLDRLALLTGGKVRDAVSAASPQCEITVEAPSGRSCSELAAWRRYALLLDRDNDGFVITLRKGETGSPPPIPVGLWGRQNDIQGHGDFRYGNWISGIPFIDNILVGDQSLMPDTLKHDKANNKYYMLPFILGLLGMFYQYQRGKQGKKDFWVVMLLFFFTGIAIVLYLNQYPYQPRERDYAYAGSFYAFAIWIGFGVLYLWDLLQKKMDPRNAAIIVTAVCLFAVPVNMAAQNWDDHDRSGRYATIAHAKNYLSSCAPNAILFTYGDNDTFPLWYAQEVEGFRRDVRIVNLSLLAGDWYIDQMKRKAYESDGVPISFTKDQYHAGVRDFVTIEERVQQPFSMKDVMEFVASDRPETKSNRYQGGAVDFIPTRNLYIPVDKEKVLANGTVQPEDSALIVDRVEIQLKGNSLTKSQLMVLDILATNNWERPVYFGVGMGQDSYMGFDKYFQLEGAAYRVVPIKTENNSAYYDFGRINSAILYDNLMNKFVWGNIKDPKVNIDHFHDNTIAVMKYRNTFLRLAEQLMQEASTETRVMGDSIINEITDSTKIQEAIRVLDKSLEEIPLYQVPADFFLLNYISIYYAAGEYEKGNDLAWALALDNAQTLRYIGSLSLNRRKALENDERRSMQALQMLVDMARRNGETAFAQEIQDMVESTLSGRPVTSKRVKESISI